MSLILWDYGISEKRTTTSEMRQIASGLARSPHSARRFLFRLSIGQGVARSLYIGERCEPTCIYTGYALLSIAKKRI